MSRLSDTEKRYLERILGLETGYVLGNSFSDATFGEFFKRHQIDIHSTKYHTRGSSKAKKLRTFWEIEPDEIVAKILAELLNSYETDCELNNRDIDTNILEKCRKIVTGLSGVSNGPEQQTETVFLNQEFCFPNVQNLPIDSSVAKIIVARLDEASRALSVNANLSVIFLCGSILEGVLLGTAQRQPAKFNKAKASPKTKDGKVKPFHEWSLSNFIDVACETGLLKPDVKKFSHGLRDFRNYIHPHEQLESKFSPDQHTAKVCFQVLKASSANLAGER